MATAPHTHTQACLGGNELNELCCLHLAGQRLQASERWVVRCLEDTVNTFTDSAEDATAIAVAAGYHPTGEAPWQDPQQWP